MELLHIEPYIQTPEVNFDPNSGKLELIGKSYPADAVEFYNPIITWCESYIKSPAQKTELVCEVEYLNSASQKQLVDLIATFIPLHRSEKTFNVHWKYEEGDDDILSVGQLIEHELEIPFTYEEI